ncbi:MAG: GtrA family protein [Clostridia bacterium]|nr:GtrA family protein [Clostridia bacterium]
MNVYDFDETIYNGDSTRDFYFFCLKKYPRIALLWPYQLFHFLLFAAGFHKKTAFKERFYRFFRLVPDMEKAVSDFWDRHFCNIKKWYLDTKKPDDVIVSASPAFLLEIPCRKLGIPAPIASLADMHTGKYQGENCYGEEKPPRFYAVYPEGKVDAFYSDSLSDTPLARLAKESYIVKGEMLIPWEEYTPSRLSRLKKTFLSPSFIRFLLVGGLSTLATTFFAVLYEKWISVPVLAFAVGYFTTLVLSFFVNCGFTFGAKPSFAKYIKYIVSYIPNFLIQCFSVFLLHHVLGLWEIIAYLLAAIIGVPVTYLLMKVFTFKKQ